MLALSVLPSLCIRLSVMSLCYSYFYMKKIFALYLTELILVYSICLNGLLPTGLALMLTKRVFVSLVMRKKSP